MFTKTARPAHWHLARLPPDGPSPGGSGCNERRVNRAFLIGERHPKVRRRVENKYGNFEEAAFPLPLQPFCAWALQAYSLIGDPASLMRASAQVAR